MNKKRIAFIIPHFGKFNNYFQAWLHSCAFNPDITWLIFTDDQNSYSFPNNVKVQYTTFEKTKELIQKKFDFPIILNNPYQLCEFKLTYGEVYEEYLNEYDFWGFCDTDVIWGNLRRHITDQILEEHSKISWRGHLTLFKNDKRINALYRNKIEGVEFYRYALSNETGFPLASDEREINYIFEEEGEKIYKELIFADLKIRSFNFNVLHFGSSQQYKNEHQIFYWSNGELYRLFIHLGELYRENFAYIHFLKRPMNLEGKLDAEKNMLIIPNRIIYTNTFPCLEEIINYSKQKTYWSYIISKITVKYLKSKIKYYKSKKSFAQKLHFLPIKPTHVVLPDTVSEKLSNTIN